MTLYLDTSLVVTLLTAEAETPRTRDWVRAQTGQRFAVSDWVMTEFSAALSMKVRSGNLSDEQRKATQSWFDRLAAESFERLLVGREHFAYAARLAERSASGLGGGDALHLAIAEAASTVLCTRDKGLADAGAELGFRTVLI